MNITLGAFTNVDLEEAIEVYCLAFSREPWNEQFDDLEPMRKYFESYFQSSCSFGFCAKWENQLIGIGMGHIHPTIQGIRYSLDDFFYTSSISRPRNRYSAFKAYRRKV